MHILNLLFFINLKVLFNVNESGNIAYAIVVNPKMVHANSMALTCFSVYENPKFRYRLSLH